MRQLRGRAVLLDFWDYTCINCIRTLPYLKEWHRRYHDQGLSIVGVHTPEFYFAQVPELVEIAVQEFNIQYPVVLDNDYQIWQAYANHYWPSKYLIDPEGYLRFATFGEGSYGEMESAIQAVLSEAGIAKSFPPLMQPIRPLDFPGAIAACRRPTPELYLGYKRGRLANEGGFEENRIYRYRFGAAPTLDLAELDGLWESRADCIEARGHPSRLRLAYQAAEVNLVGAAGPDQPRVRIEVRENGRPVPEGARGEDIRVDGDGHTYLQVDRPRMFSLIRRDVFTEATLELETSAPGCQLFAFTFVSCP
jgi:thiol-disulfide isomerase/thioredoxin